MKIYINDELVDVQLENEKTSMDLHDSLHKELKKHKKYIYDFKLKRKNTMDEEQTWDNIPLSEVDSIYFYVGSFQDMLINTLYTLNQYLDEIGTKIYESESIHEGDINELREGTGWIFEFIDVLAGLLKTDIENINVKMPEKNHENLKNNMLEFKELIFKLTSENFHSLKIQIIKTLRVLKYFSLKVFNHILSNNISYDELIHYLDDFENQIEQIQQDLVTINTNLQTGNDQKALLLLQKLFDQLEFNFFILTTAIERNKENTKINSNIKQFLDPIMEILNDLSSAMNDMDMIAVGDILEYELSEKISNIKNYIPELKNSLTNLSSIEK